MVFEPPCKKQLVASEQIAHVSVPRIQDPVEHDEPLAIGDMVVDTSFGFCRECEIIRTGHSLYNGQQKVLYPEERRESYTSGAMETSRPARQVDKQAKTNVGVIWSAMPSAGNFDRGRCMSWLPPTRGGIQVPILRNDSESYSSCAQWKHRDQFGALTNKRRRMSE